MATPRSKRPTRTSASARRLLRFALASILVSLAASFGMAPPPQQNPPLLETPAASTPRAQLEASDEAVAAFFDDYISGTIHRLDLPGGAIVVVRNSRPILAKGYGYADLASRRPVGIEDSLFRAASISKTPTWLLVMQLVEEGRLDLDLDVNA